MNRKILKIGKSKGNEKRKDFVEFLRCKEKETFAYYEEEIQKLECIDVIASTW
jgi:hypothetical protein